MKRKGSLVIFFIFLVLLGVTAWLLYQNLPGPVSTLIPTRQAPTGPIVGSAQQFFPNIRFSENPIAYEIEEACSEAKREQMLEAFGILENKTILSFEERSSGPRIIVTCSQLAPEPSLKGHFVAGEGGPTKIINATRFMIIEEGKIALYRSEDCDSSHVALHELLHALGFDHNQDRESIMYPTLSCDQTLDTSIVDEINRLYTIESLPDLTLLKANATKSGPYLSFTLEIMNQGLAKARDVSLDIKADDRVLNASSLGNFEPGTRKILTIQNMKIQRSAQTILFSVYAQERELTMDANEIRLEVAN